ncbi:hypothetical protein ACIOMP_06865 [Pseudomonas protegens]|uniref:hypothetical protein n=1 Tax=Pseudomonas protegens TaxID=380021 RepID=UPI00380B2458
MKIELEELDSQAGYLLKFGGFCLMFDSRSAAESFMQVLKGRIDSLRPGMPAGGEAKAKTRADP